MISQVQAEELFRRTYRAEPAAVAWAPGRVNLIGEHVDYAGGCVLPVALSRGVTVAVGAGRSRLIRAFSTQFAAAGIVELDPDRQPLDGFPGFVQAVARELGCSAADVSVEADLPVGRGLSSSAAFSVSLAAALLISHPGVTKPSALGLCRSCQRAERDALGVACGLMDQYAAVFGRAGLAIHFDARHLNHDNVPVALGGAALLVVDSGQPRDLAHSGYNRRRSELDEGLNAAQERLGGFASFRDVDSKALLAVAEVIPDPEGRRLRHVVSEQRRVGQFVTALGQGRLEEMGRLLNETHCSLRDDYEVSTAEIDQLWETLNMLPGVYGARLVGGGFGGGLLALAEKSVVSNKLSEALELYHQDTRLAPAWETVSFGDGARFAMAGQEPQLLEDWLG